jgi:hypothetical protein
MRSVRCLPLVGALFLIACASPQPERASRQQCEALRAHAIDLQIDLARQYGTDGVALEAHRTALQRSLGDDYVKLCQEERMASAVACAIRATDPPALDACLGAEVSP